MHISLRAALSYEGAGIVDKTLGIIGRNLHLPSERSVDVLQGTIFWPMVEWADGVGISMVLFGWPDFARDPKEMVTATFLMIGEGNNREELESVLAYTWDDVTTFL